MKLTPEVCHLINCNSGEIPAGAGAGAGDVLHISNLWCMVPITLKPAGAGAGGGRCAAGAAGAVGPDARRPVRRGGGAEITACRAGARHGALFGAFNLPALNLTRLSMKAVLKTLHAELDLAMVSRRE